MAPDLGGSGASRAGRGGASLLASVLALLLLAFAAWYGACTIGAQRRSVADDAYITFNYARNLAEGRGLRFNASDADPTPGCSTELHALFAAGAIALEVDPLVATRALSLGAVLAIGVLLGWMGARLAGASADRGLLVGAALAWVLMILPETAVHLTSGMETLLFALVHALALAWAAWASTRAGRLGWRAALLGALVLSPCILARPEGAVLAALYAASVVAVRASARGLGAALRECAPVAAVTALAVGGFFAWRVGYYGSVLGNPFYVKSANAIFGSRGALLPGFEPAARFALLRLLPALVLLVLARDALAPSRQARTTVGLLLAPSLFVLAAYSFVVHEMASGSRFEYPLFVPWLGASATALLSLRSHAAFRGVLASAVVVVPAWAAPVRTEVIDFLRHPRSSAVAWLRSPSGDNALARAGRDLGRTKLGGQATILLSAAGQIPWYSGFEAVDWLGLNDTRLSGREALTIDEVWNYIGERNPDVVQSILPPAARTGASRDDDENFRSPFVQATLDGRGSGLFEHWDRERLSRMFYAEMQWVRERCVFGACYKLGSAWGDDWWVFLYVRKDSPHREALLDALRRSKSTDRTSDLSERFAFDPRALGN